MTKVIVIMEVSDMPVMQDAIDIPKEFGNWNGSGYRLCS
jgi:hypothetical protein